VIIVAVVAALAGGAVGGFIGARQSDSGYHLDSAPKGTTQRAPQTVAGVAQRVTPSVVDIKVSSASSGEEGSGFLVQGGYIMTNNHVVASAANGGGDLQVNFNDGTRTGARVVGHDSTYDIAVLKPDTTGGRKPLPLGNSDNMVVGDPVIAVGSPLGLTGTVTTGIISAKNRPVTASGEDGTQQSYINALQTDAAINPGNSGGPLVDSAGEVIGVNSAIQSSPGSSQTGQQGGSIGLGFAIPINKAREVAEQLLKTGKVKHPVIGALIDMGFAGDGARIAQNSRQGPGIIAGGPAAKAGLKAGDVITKVDGRTITSAEELLVDIKSHQPGQNIELTYKRGGGEHTVKLKLGAQ
jgi:putative serine protease PepD